MRKKGIPVALVTAVMCLYKDGVLWKVVEWAMRKRYSSSIGYSSDEPV